MAGDASTDPLFFSNRRKLKEIINNYSHPNQEPTVVTEEKPCAPEKLSNALKEKIHQLEKDHKEANQKWIEFLQKYESKLKDSFDRIRQKRKFIELVYNGIPEAFRIKFWICLLGINNLDQDEENKYNEIKEKSKRFARLEDVFQIDKDVQRTFRDRAEFKKDFSQRQCMLFNVLMAYSFYNDTLGYCQGMHQCAGLLLLYVPDEKSAFWGLHRLMTDERYSLHGMFLDRFPKYLRLRDEFERILQKKNKSLYNHLMECQTVTDTYLMLWYFTVFQADFPLALSLRIWDIFLLEGDVIFLPMAYTLITFKEKELRKEDCPKLCITNFKHTLQYEESNIIEHFRRNFKTIAQSSKSQLRMRAPENEIPSKFGTLLDVPDLFSNGFDDPDESLTDETKKKENESLIMRASIATGFERQSAQRLSYFALESNGSTSQTRPRVNSEVVKRALEPAVGETDRLRSILDNLEGDEKATNGSVSEPQDGSSPGKSRDSIVHTSSASVELNGDVEPRTPTSAVSDEALTTAERSFSDSSRLRPNRLYKQNTSLSPPGAIALLASTVGQERMSPVTSNSQRSRNSSQNSKRSERGYDDTDGGLTSNDESLGGGSLIMERPNVRKPQSPSPTSPAFEASFVTTPMPSAMHKRNASSTGLLPTRNSQTALNGSSEFETGQSSTYVAASRVAYGYPPGLTGRSRGTNRVSMSPIALPETASGSQRSHRLSAIQTGSFRGSVPINVTSDYSTRQAMSERSPNSRSFLYTQGVVERLGPQRMPQNNRNSWSDLTYNRIKPPKPGRAFATMSSRSQEPPPNISRFSEVHNPFMKLETEFSANGSIQRPRGSSTSSNGFVPVSSRKSSTGKNPRATPAENGYGDQGRKRSTSKKSGDKVQSPVGKSGDPNQSKNEIKSKSLSVTTNL